MWAQLPLRGDPARMGPDDYPLAPRVLLLRLPAGGASTPAPSAALQQLREAGLVELRCDGGAPDGRPHSVFVLARMQVPSWLGGGGGGGGSGGGEGAGNHVASWKPLAASSAEKPLWALLNPDAALRAMGHPRLPGDPDPAVGDAWQQLLLVRTVSEGMGRRGSCPGRAGGVGLVCVVLNLASNRRA